MGVRGEEKVATLSTSPMLAFEYAWYGCQNCVCKGRIKMFAQFWSQCLGRTRML